MVSAYQADLHISLGMGRMYFGRMKFVLHAASNPQRRPFAWMPVFLGSTPPVRENH
jgi:hypothetical protein